MLVYKFFKESIFYGGGSGDNVVEAFLSMGVSMSNKRLTFYIVSQSDSFATV